MLSRRLITLACTSAVAAAGVVVPAAASAGSPPYGVTTAVAVTGAPTGIAIDPATQTAFVTQADANSLAVVDLASATVTHTIDVGTSPGAVAVDPMTHRAYAASAVDGAVTVVDTATDTVVATPTFDGAPNALAVDPASGTVLVAGSDGTLSVVDAAGSVKGSLQIGAEADRIAVDAATDTAYVSDGPDNSVVAVDLATLTIARTTTDPSFRLPYAIGVDAVTGKVYVGNLLGEGDTVSVIDTTNGDAVQTIAVGGSPLGIAVDGADRRVYVANNADSSMSVLDTSTGTVLDTVGLAAPPQSVALDSASHTAYATTGSANTLLGVVAGGTPSPPAPRASSVSLTAGDAITGSAVTLTATVTPAAADGTVAFSADGTAIAGCTASTIAAGTATCSTTFASYGTKQISAAYSGSNGFASSSGSLTLLVADGKATFVGSVAGCTDVVGTIVAVDFGPFGGAVTRGCDLQRPVRGIDLLHDTGYAATGTEHDGPAFVCRLGTSLFDAGRQYPTPATEKCLQTPPASAYWSYWLAQPGQNTWDYSPYGAYSDTPVPGEVEAWTYGGTDVAGTTGLPSFSPDQVRTSPQARVTAGAVTVRGAATVGATVRAAVAGVTPATSSLSYQWLRDGVPVAHARTKSFRLSAADLRRHISVRLVAAQSGYSSVTVVSRRTAPVSAGRFATRAVTVRGTARVGRILTAVVAASGVARTTAAYRWYRDGRAISGATHRTYRVRHHDAGHRISVRLTRTAPGYRRAVSTAHAVVVSRLAG